MAKNPNCKVVTTRRLITLVDGVPTVGDVSFRLSTDDGRFSASLPGGVGKWAYDKYGRDEQRSFDAVRDLSADDGYRIVSTTLAGVVDNYPAVIRAYVDWQRGLEATKVIVVDFAKNLKMSFGQGRGEISFAASPAMSLTYRVTHRITADGRPAYGDMRDGRFVMGAKPAGNYEMKWTQEREDFLANAVAGFEGLIVKLCDFFADAETNVQIAIDRGAGLLPSPAQEEVADVEDDIDTSDIPEMGEEFFKRARLVRPT